MNRATRHNAESIANLSAAAIIFLVFIAAITIN